VHDIGRVYADFTRPATIRELLRRMLPSAVITNIENDFLNTRFKFSISANIKTYRLISVDKFCNPYAGLCIRRPVITKAFQMSVAVAAPPMFGVPYCIRRAVVRTVFGAGDLVANLS
jgi:hypothetical protein